MNNHYQMHKATNHIIMAQAPSRYDGFLDPEGTTLAPQTPHQEPVEPQPEQTPDATPQLAQTQQYQSQPYDDWNNAPKQTNTATTQQNTNTQEEGKMPEGLMDLGVTALIIIVALLTIGMILARLYRRASKEVSFVRTGFGGEKIIMNGGALVLPVLHETIPVNMNTLRLAVNRASEQALITRDRMRVDVVAEFYVRVQPTQEAISSAAQTLGSRTMHPQELKELVEGKFVDSLRSVAAEMTMEELHEKRVNFVQKVQNVVSEDLLKNGLELETVSLTGLDQTAMEFFNPNNAFDAEGLTRLTEEIQARRKIRNDIEQETEVQIRNKNLEAEQKNLQIAREEEYARLAQEREIEIRRASQSSEIIQEQAEKERQAQEAKITAQQEVQLAQILADRAIEEQRIDKERTVREKDIARERAIETQEIEKAKTVKIAEQDRDIAVAEKSKEQSNTQAQADQARALAVAAEEKVDTARAKEIAERQKQIELIEAAKEAEREAISITVAAEAQKEAALDEADALRQVAQGEADAEKLRADAAQVRYSVDAAGQESINKAANLLSDEQISMQVKLELIQNLDSMIRESAKPMENFEGIKIVQLSGLGESGLVGNGGASTGDSANNNGGGNLADQVISSALKYRAQAPLLDSLMKEVGIDGNDLNSFTKSLAPQFGQTQKLTQPTQPDPTAKPQAAAEQVKQDKKSA